MLLVALERTTRVANGGVDIAHISPSVSLAAPVAGFAGNSHVLLVALKSPLIGAQNRVGIAHVSPGVSLTASIPDLASDFQMSIVASERAAGVASFAA